MFNLLVPHQHNDLVVNVVAVDDKDGRLKARSKLDMFEKSLQAAIGSEHGDRDEINSNGLKEYFLHGVYVRELFIPADHVIVSQLWKKERMWIIAYGEVSFAMEMGTQRIVAPYTKIVSPGSKVALYAHTDTLWFAVAASNATNSSEAEAELIAKGYDECHYPWSIDRGTK